MILASMLGPLVEEACSSCPQLEEECRLFVDLVESIGEAEGAPLLDALAALVAALAGAARRAGCGLQATILYGASGLLRRASAA